MSNSFAAFRAAAELPDYEPPELDEKCPHDGRYCFVSPGTDDAHWRCGTSACHASTVTASEHSINAYDPRAHDERCDYHLDQYPWECCCGVSGPRAGHLDRPTTAPVIPASGRRDA